MRKQSETVSKSLSQNKSQIQRLHELETFTQSVPTDPQVFQWFEKQDFF